MRTNCNGGLTLWFTGLSGSGKSTLSAKLASFFEDTLGIKCMNIDGDKIRKGINSDLKFSKQDRAQNIRRVAEISKLCNSQGLVVIVSCISPYQIDRQFAKSIHKNYLLDFYQFYASSSVEDCEKRDIKGLYKLAKQGKIQFFTGVSDPYEVPKSPDLVIQTGRQSQDQSFQKILQFLLTKGHIKQNKNKTFDYIDFQADIEELNILQTIQQKWTQLDNLMSYDQIIESLYFMTVKKNMKEVFQPIPLFMLCRKQFVEKTQKFKNPFSIRILNKIDKRQIAVLEDAKFQVFRTQQILSKLFGVFSKKHPFIERILQKGDFIMSGKNLRFKNTQIYFHDQLDYLRKQSSLIKAQFKQKKGDCLFAFQLRNPLHNGHLYLLENAKNQLLQKGFKKPILLLHPCGGWVKEDDVPLNVRIKQHQKLLEKSQFFKEDEYILAIWPSPMFYAGPRQVLWHFGSRQNADVNYMIVGRDPAGIKHPENLKINLYDQYDGQRVLQNASIRGLIKTKIIPFKQICWNKKEQKLEQYCQSRSQDYQSISGSQMRKMAKEGKDIPQWIMNQQSWQVLKQFYKGSK